MRYPGSYITDEDLQALVDGAYDSKVHENIMNMVKGDPLLRARLEQLFEQKYLLKEWWLSLPLA